MKQRIAKNCAAALGWIVWIVILPYAAEGIWFRLTEKRPTWTDWINWNSAGVFVNVFVAAGTIAAAWIALHIALSGRRQQIYDSHAAAQLTAAGATPKVLNSRSKTGSAIIQVRSAQELLESTSEPSQANFSDLHDYVGIALTTLTGVTDCTFDEIRSMSPLPEQCAMNIEAAQGRIRVANSNLKEIQQSYGRLSQSFEHIATPSITTTPGTPSTDPFYKIAQALDILRGVEQGNVNMAWSYCELIVRDVTTALEEAEILFASAHKICSDQSAVIDDLILDAKISSL